jgi:protein-S-isoprenylcysteine O-methyltransferase Ste14
VGVEAAEATVKLFPAVHVRIARPASTGVNIIKTLAQSLTMWGIFFGVLPALIYRLEGSTWVGRYRFASRWWRFTGVTVFMLGWVLAWTSAVFMVARGKGTPLPADATRELVIDGPYRYVRNPMAMGSFAQGIAVGLYLGSPSVVAYVVVGMVGWNYLVRPWEEMDLEWRFGEPYAHYRDSVRCWVPHLHAYERAPQ